MNAEQLKNAYEGAREDLLIWKQRALAAEAALAQQPAASDVRDAVNTAIESAALLCDERAKNVGDRKDYQARAAAAGLACGIRALQSAPAVQADEGKS